MQSFAREQQQSDDDHGQRADEVKDDRHRDRAVDVKIAQWVLTTFYGFDIDSSVAAALLFHLVGTLPVVIAGLVLFAVTGMSVRDVRGRMSS